MTFMAVLTGCRTMAAGISLYMDITAVLTYNSIIFLEQLLVLPDWMNFIAVLPDCMTVSAGIPDSKQVTAVLPDWMTVTAILHDCIR